MYGPASHGYDNGSMRARTVLLAVPSMAMAVVGLAMFGPGAVQAFDGARIRGGPVSGPQRLAWRITVLQRFRSIDSTRNIGPLIVRARDDAPLAVAQHLSREAVARCETNQDGICEVALDFDAPVVGPVHAVVTAERGGIVLAKGEAQNPAGWGQSRGHPAQLQGSKDGDFDVEVFAVRGVFAAPFPSELRVVARDADPNLSDAIVKIRANGADIEVSSPRSSRPSSDIPRYGWTSDARDGTSDRSSVETPAAIGVQGMGRYAEATFDVTAYTHAVDVDVDVIAKNRKASWHGILPVVPGAIWVDPDAERHDKLRVVSPVPRDLVYATIADEHVRYWGGAIALVRDAHGFAVGEIDWPVHTAGWVTVSSDPLASGAGTVGWPISHWDERPFPDQLLLDGMPAAEKRDQERRYHARVLAAVALGAAAVLEGIFLAHGARESGARGPRAWAWTAIAIATVALAFAAIGVVVMWKTSS